MINDLRKLIVAAYEATMRLIGDGHLHPDRLDVLPRSFQGVDGGRCSSTC
jgi:hypothetical protein